MNELNIKLNDSEVQALLNLMGETPAKMGFFPLMVNIGTQAERERQRIQEEASRPPIPEVPTTPEVIGPLEA